MASLKGKWIAPRAAKWLAGAEAPSIHSVFNQSINLIDHEGSLLSVVLPGLGPGPFAIVAAPENASFLGFSELEIESRLQLLPDLIRIGNLAIQLSDAREWNPNLDWTKLKCSLNPSIIEQLRSLLEKHAPPGSFAPLVSGISQVQDSMIQARALQAAMEPSRRLIEALTDNDHSAIQQAAGRLAGLGGGVTPSGDDYLQGIVHAIWTRLPEGQAIHLGNAIASEAIPRTNAISGEWLEAAARGEVGEDWHLLANALGADAELEQAAARLIRRGHTSGADTLAGYLSALSALG